MHLSPERKVTGISCDLCGKGQPAKIPPNVALLAVMEGIEQHLADRHDGRMYAVELRFVVIVEERTAAGSLVRLAELGLPGRTTGE